MNRKDLIEKIIKVAEDYKNGELYATGAMTDVGILVDEYTETVAKNCPIPDVVGRSEQLLAVAEYVYNHFDDSSSKTAKDYLQDFLSQ